MVSPVVQKIGGLLTPIAAQECEQTAISTSTSTFQLFSPVRPPRSSHALNSFGIRRRDPYIHLDEQRRSHIRHRRRSTLKVLSKGGSQDRAGPAACDGGMKAVLLAISLISPLDHPCCLNCRSTSCRRSCFNLFHLQTRCSPLLGTHQHSRTTGTSPSHISARHRFSAREASGVLLPARSEEGANREATKRCPRRARSRPWSQNGRRPWSTVYSRKQFFAVLARPKFSCCWSHLPAKIRILLIGALLQRLVTSSGCWTRRRAPHPSFTALHVAVRMPAWNG